MGILGLGLREQRNNTEELFFKYKTVFHSIGHCRCFQCRPEMMQHIAFKNQCCR